VSRPDRFLETVIAPPPRLGALASVRIRSTYLDRLADLEGRVLDGEGLLDSERSELAAFQAVHRWRRAYTITIKPVG
jgi:hypothetical protein